MKIAELYLQAKEKKGRLGVREIARTLNISPAAASNMLSEKHPARPSLEMVLFLCETAEANLDQAVEALSHTRVIRDLGVQSPAAAYAAAVILCSSRAIKITAWEAQQFRCLASDLSGL